MEHGLKDIAFYAQKHNFLLIRDKPPRGAHICETGLW